jgi:hypothetical protein
MWFRTRSVTHGKSFLRAFSREKAVSNVREFPFLEFSPYRDAALVTSCHRGPREQSGAQRDPVDLLVRE